MLQRDIGIPTRNQETKWSRRNCARHQLSRGKGLEFRMHGRREASTHNPTTYQSHSISIHLDDDDVAFALVDKESMWRSKTVEDVMISNHSKINRELAQLKW
jgi:hypothetical protein